MQEYPNLFQVRDELLIGVGVWVCPECKSVHDRDVNAALNIRDEGLRLLKEQKNNDKK